MLLGAFATCVKFRAPVALSLIAILAASSPLEAQSRSEGSIGPSWDLRGLRSGHCIRFLVEPAMAAKHRRDGYRPLRASEDSTLHPALRGVIERQAEFAGWTPSSLCFFFVDTVNLGGRTIVAKNTRNPQMVGVWILAMAEQGSGAPRDVVLDLSSGSAQVVRAAEAVKLRIREASSKVTESRDTSNEVQEVRLGRTRLVWNGRAAGDSARLEQPTVDEWVVKGSSGISWNVHLQLEPVWSRPLVGVLSVEGKDNLAKNLKASPIRFVGPRYLGGSIGLMFSR
jgi:hypothetical protein